MAWQRTEPSITPWSICRACRWMSLWPSTGRCRPRAQCICCDKSAERLREAHAVGLVHRDIKPANILACQIGGMHDVTKLFDFGLVRVHALSADAGLTGLGTIAGTPAFMSPEQAAGTAEVDARSDIYSLGAVAYFLLTGQAPFVRSTSVQTMAAHLAEPLVPPRLLCPEIPDDLEGVVLRCLAKEPNQRYADIAAVEEALACCACADSWSGEQAAVWWRDRKHDSVAME